MHLAEDKGTFGNPYLRWTVRQWGNGGPVAELEAWGRVADHPERLLGNQLWWLAAA